MTVASWEPRFLSGLRRTLGQYSLERLVSYYVREYQDRTSSARAELRGLAERHGVRLSERPISLLTPSETWRRLGEDFQEASLPSGSVLLDLTTMPRELLWSILFRLEARHVDVRYVYNRPAQYGEGWLARDPSDPRLIYKLSGELELGRATALVAVTGFDLERCRQAVDFFEPATVLLGVQTGGQFSNEERNRDADFRFGGVETIRTDVDAYAADHGYGALKDYVAELVRTHNVILCSFGPKPSGIALYRLQRVHRQSALAFIACKEYSEDYSVGLGDVLEGCLDFSEPTWQVP